MPPCVMRPASRTAFAAAVAAVLIAAPATTASAQGLFDFLFGTPDNSAAQTPGASAPAQGNPFANPGDDRSTQAPLPPIGEGDHVRGSGPHLIVYLDFGCPACAAGWPELIEREARLCVRHFPIASRRPRSPALHAAAEAAGLPVLAGYGIIATEGRRRIRRLRVARITETGDRALRAGETLDCDLVAVSGGWNPTLHLFSQSRGEVRLDERLGCFLPGQSAPAERPAGAWNGACLSGTCP